MEKDLKTYTTKLKVSQGKINARYISLTNIKDEKRILVSNSRTKKSYELLIKKDLDVKGLFYINTVNTVENENDVTYNIELMNDSVPKVMIIESLIFTFYISNRNILYIISSDENDFYE